MSYDQKYIATKDLNEDIRGTFKDYRKRKVSIVDRGEGQVTINQNPEWSGGTREYETFFSYDGERYRKIPRDEAGQTRTRTREDGTPIVGLAGPFEETLMHEEVVCVTTGYFCGKTATMQITGASLALTGISKEG